FWLSRYAGGAISGHPNDPIADDTDDEPDEDLKSQAVFVLSQLPRGEGVPDLLQAARSNKSPRVRSQALFWLGQSGDPRALALVAIAGIALGIVAIVLVSRQTPAEGSTAEHRSLGVGAALASGVAIGLFLLTIAQTKPAAGMWPLVASRGVSVTLICGIAAV